MDANTLKVYYIKKAALVKSGFLRIMRKLSLLYFQVDYLIIYFIGF